MREFAIRLSSVQEVQEFVAIATAQTFPIFVRDRYTQVNGKSFMEMFCLNFTHPLFAMAECGEEQLLQLMKLKNCFQRNIDVVLILF